VYKNTFRGIYALIVDLLAYFVPTLWRLPVALSYPSGEVVITRFHSIAFIINVMHTSSPKSAATGSFFYEVTTPEQRAGAATHMQHLLHQRLPLLTHEDWLVILDEYAPTLRIKEVGGAVIVAEGLLTSLTSWAVVYHATRYEFPKDDKVDPEQLGLDVYYLARHIQAYAKQAKVLLAADPDLVDPLSIGQMRDIMHRLAVGNTVAERCAETRPPRIAAIK
jgi:hypothetical protein